MAARKRGKKKFLADQLEDSVTLHRPRQKLSHVAEEYAAKGDRQSAESLTRYLTPRARACVL